MFSTNAKEKVKNWGLFGAVGTLAAIAATALGLEFYFVGYIASLFLIQPLIGIFKKIDFDIMAKIKEYQQGQEKAKDNPNERLRLTGEFLSANKNLYLLVAAMFAISAGVAIAAYLQTGSLLYSLSFLILPTIINKLRTKNKDVSEFMFISSYSASRDLNLENEDEAAFEKTLNTVCKELNLPVPAVTYIEILGKLNESNMDEFRKKFTNKKLTSLSDEELVSKMKSLIPPNIAATNTILDGNHLSVFSSTFKHEYKLTEQELKAVLMHELGHHANQDSLRSLLVDGLYWTTAILGLSSLRLAGIALLGGIHYLSIKFKRSSETCADLHSAQYGGADGLISFFNKLTAFKKNIILGIKDNSTDGLKEKTYLQKVKGAYFKWSANHPGNKERIAVLSTFKDELNEISLNKSASVKA